MKSMSYEQFSQIQISDKPTLVKYSAKWCTFCKKAHQRDTNLFEQIDTVDIFEVDMGNMFDEKPWALLDVEVVPSYRFFKDGKVYAFLSGPHSQGAILDAIEDITK